MSRLARSRHVHEFLTSTKVVTRHITECWRNGRAIPLATEAMYTGLKPTRTSPGSITMEPVALPGALFH